MAQPLAPLGDLLSISETLPPANVSAFCEEHLDRLSRQLRDMADGLPETLNDLACRTDTELAAQTLANLARGGQLIRTRIAEQGCPGSLAKVLEAVRQETTTDRVKPTVLTVQLLRLSANLVVDHDVNRQLFLKSGVLKQLIAIVQATETQLEVLRTALTAMLNLAVDNELCQKVLIENGAIEALVQTFRNYTKINEDPATVNLVARNLATLAEHDASLFHFHLHQAASALLGLATAYAPALRSPDGQEIFMEFLSVLEGILRHPPIQIEVVKAGKVPVVLDLYEILVLGHLLTPGTGQGSSGSEAAAPYASVESLHLDSDEELEDDDDEDTTSTPTTPSAPHEPGKAGGPKHQAIDLISRVLVIVTSNDETMNTLMTDPAVFSRFSAWLWLRPQALQAHPSATRQVREEDPRKTLERAERLQAVAALAIANLARSEANCVAIVRDHRMGGPLVDLLKETKNYQIQHSVTGLLRNLTIPEANKVELGQTTILLPLVARLVDTKIVQLQMNAIRVLKHLVSQSSTANALRMLQPLDPTTAPALVHSVAQAAAAVVATPMGEAGPDGRSFDDTALGMLLNVLRLKAPEAIHSEGARAVADLVKTLFTAACPADDQMEDKDVQTARSCIVAHADHVVPPLAYLLTQAKFQVLQNEALFALTLLLECATPSPVPVLDALNACLERPDVVPTGADGGGSQLGAGGDMDTDEERAEAAADGWSFGTRWLPAALDLIEDNNKAAEIRSNAAKFLLRVTSKLTTQDPQTWSAIRSGLTSAEPTAVVPLSPQAARSPALPELIELVERLRETLRAL
ncbi:hypothetical protein IWQ60_001556 [Tieghemiomyces parasiticus]|uniref:Uncharacterized protein n=1 Tax=Tieghemiomyces parasiticus TaxID=78921 RepID=A0A9W8AJP6_9FUNG|nr:hypothetical protein IWQ60_001556 [Tieghemiomyces parasiticus]